MVIPDGGGTQLGHAAAALAAARGHPYTPTDSEMQAETDHLGDADVGHASGAAGCGDGRAGAVVSSAVLEERRRFDEARRIAAEHTYLAEDDASAWDEGSGVDGTGSTCSCDSLLGTEVVVREGGQGEWHGRVHEFDPVDDVFLFVDDVSGEAAYLHREEGDLGNASYW